MTLGKRDGGCVDDIRKKEMQEVRMTLGSGMEEVWMTGGKWNGGGVDDSGEVIGGDVDDSWEGEWRMCG